MNPHLQRLEAEAIHIIRETAAAFRRPVFMYSIGKDSSVLLHLACKAFAAGRPPFPLLHIDTLWKFREMIAFRDATAARLKLDLIVYTNDTPAAAQVDPCGPDSGEYTRVMKTDALRRALDLHGFDAAIGGARRDEEKSRAKERVFSVRGPGHMWEPRRQRPEFWRAFNTHLSKDETMRVFPLSNWTEVDVWEYIQKENIPVVPLYFSAARPVVMRQGQLIMVDDDRLPLHGETPSLRRIRFRSLGCYPLTAAVESEASTIAQIVEETRLTRLSERAGRLIDAEHSASMERKKREGYF